MAKKMPQSYQNTTYQEKQSPKLTMFFLPALPLPFLIGMAFASRKYHGFAENENSPGLTIFLHLWCSHTACMDPKDIFKLSEKSV